jgi:hypothetical protein
MKNCFAGLIQGADLGDEKSTGRKGEGRKRRKAPCGYGAAHHAG